MSELDGKRATMYVVLVVIGVIIAGILLSNRAVEAVVPGQQVHFNGQTLDLTGAANVMVQSSDQVRTWDADQNGGAITQTTSIVTVTIWMKP